jgi:hypothetical protein
MDMYTMNENFLAQDVVDEFISAIWTERYTSAGEVQLVVPASAILIDRLVEGTYLGLRGTKEVMKLHTQSIEGTIMTVTGKTLVQGALDERPFWATNPDSSAADDRIVDKTVEGKVGQIIADAVEDMVINTTAFGGSYAPANLEWELEEIPGLEIGDVDVTGDDERVTIPIGPLYSSIQPIAEKYGIGISLYLEQSNIDTGFTLKFKTYTGEDRTSDQSTNPLIRLTPDMDSLTDIKEIRSLQFYKNTVYVYYQGIITVHYEDPLNIPEGLDRRVMITNAEGEPVGHKVTYKGPWYGGGQYSNYVVDAGDIAAFRAQHARDALANNNYIRAIDGQTSPINEFNYGEDYFLGDVIELEGISGNIAKARVTEYVRSQDKTGEREYPTISVVTE